MADNGGCIIYLLSSTSMWEAHKTLSSVSSYSTNVLCGRNKIKIEPVVESDYNKNCKKLNKPQEYIHFECEVCTKLFNTKDKLIVHMSQHTGGKQYKCKICINFFSSNSNLTRHGIIHSSEKPYNCKFCIKTFACSGDLKKHSTVHAGEKPYDCKICSKNIFKKLQLKETLMDTYR